MIIDKFIQTLLLTFVFWPVIGLSFVIAMYNLKLSK